MNTENDAPKYTCGFLFSGPAATSVVLIKKQRPEWQKGRWNGVGGSIEPGETPEQCMRREFREETGLDVVFWEQFATLSDVRGSYRVVFFYAMANDMAVIQTMTDEVVEWHSVRDLPDVIQNLRWLIPLAKSMPFEHADSFEIIEKEATTPMSRLSGSVPGEATE